MNNTKLSVIKRLIERLERETNEDLDISFEFLTTTLFPQAAENFRNFVSKNYIEGYNDGYKDGLEHANSRSN